MNAVAQRRAARWVTAVVIGGGQAGLATSRHLSAHGIDHVVLERGEVANSWRTERWDSLRLLTPNWQTSLPGFHYRGDDQDGYMTCRELVAFLDQYAQGCEAPLCCGTSVSEVSATDDGYRVLTNRGIWRCHTLVMATGPYNKPTVPLFAQELPANITSLTPYQYRNPRQLDKDGVLVVGASATGVQIAEEISRSGRQVILAVGEHVRLPRHYRGRDIQHWMQATGLLDERYDEVEDLPRQRRLPSPQLVGREDYRSLDLNALRDLGVQTVGRVAGISGRQLQFSGSLANVIKLADLKQQRLLDSIDEWVECKGVDEALPDAERPAPTQRDCPPRLSLDLASGEINTVIWATGFRPDYSWLKIPVLDRKGRLLHNGGVIEDSPGLYAMGLPFMRRRKSGFLFGAGDDARDIVDHLSGHIRRHYRSKLVGVA